MLYTLRGPVATGTVVGRWTVLYEAARQHKLRFLHCRCSCGKERDVFIGSLRKGLSLSCGCMPHEKCTRHRMSYAPEYKVWQGMTQRCHNPNHSAFRNYGGRGVTVCQRWRDDFMNFYVDMGPRPSPELTLDRIDNDGHYEPGNVRWATRTQQMQNTRLAHAKTPLL